MIKPDGLWNFFKSAPDAETIGRVCMKLAGREHELDEPLNKYEVGFAREIINSDEWHMEAQERIVQRKRRDYLNKKSVDGSISEDEKAELDELNGLLSKKSSVAKTAKMAKTANAPRAAIRMYPSIHPSSPSIQDKSLSPACAREGDFPTLDAVLAWASQNANHPDGRVYPTDWAKEWYETMRTATPPWTNVKGESVLPNWKNAMTWAWKRHLKLDKDGKGGADSWKSGLPPGAIYQQEGYDANKRLGL